MKCPFCGEDDTRVIDSRPADENMSIRRRRQCDKCQKRFTTYEKVEAIPLVVIKKIRLGNLMIAPKLKKVYSVPATNGRFRFLR